MRIRPATPADDAAWDAFVEAAPTATFFHQSAWRGIIERAFRHRTHDLLAEQDGSVVGVLPLAQVKTRLFGHSLVSLPFCVYGGPVAADATVARALADAAVALRTRLGAPFLELRCRDAVDAEPFDDAPWSSRPGLYVTFRKAIDASDDANLKAIPRKQRAVVRKAMDRGLSSTADEDVDTLFRIYAESVRNLGTPVVSRRYLRLLRDTFPGRMDVVTVRDADAPLAAVLNFIWRDEVLPYYGGGTAAARAAGANDFLYWETMRRAAARGCRRFDFGRSKEGTGSYAFKKNWGFAPQPLHYRFALAPGATLPENNPLNPKYRLMIAAWKRLPLPVANVLGPHLVRGVG